MTKLEKQIKKLQKTPFLEMRMIEERWPSNSPNGLKFHGRKERVYYSNGIEAEIEKIAWARYDLLNMIRHKLLTPKAKGAK